MKLSAATSLFTAASAALTRRSDTVRNLEDSCTYYYCFYDYGYYDHYYDTYEWPDNNSEICYNGGQDDYYYEKSYTCSEYYGEICETDWKIENCNHSGEDYDEDATAWMDEGYAGAAGVASAAVALIAASLMF